MDKAKKPGPDIFRLLKVRPTKIPKTVKETPAGVPGPPPIQWKLLAALAGGVVFIAAAVFVYSLMGDQVLNDGLTLKRIFAVKDWDAFWGPTWTQMFTKPLSQQWLKATYAWDVQSAGTNLVWFHTVNITLHALSCLYFFLLVFMVSRRLHLDGRLAVDPYHVAFAAAAIFACHPLTVESVAYLGGRAAPLSAVNYFLSLDCFLLAYLAKGKTARAWGYGFSALFLAIGLTVSVDALTLPLSMLVLTAVLKKESKSWMEWWMSHPFVHSILAVAQAGLPFLIFKGMEVGSGNGTGAAVPAAAVYFATQLKALLVYYLRCFIVPVGLSLDPPFYHSSGFADVGAIAGILAAGAAFAGLYLLRKQAIPFLGLYIFVIGLVPSFSIVQPELLSDRRFYIPLTGLCLIAGWLLARLAMKSLREAAIACGAIVLVLSGLSIWRETAWQSNMALARATVAANGNSALGHTLLAVEYLKGSKVEDAVKEGGEAVKNGPDYCPAFIAEGNALLGKKDFAGADKSFTTAQKLANEQNLDPEMIANVHVGLAKALLALGDFKFAAYSAEQALGQYPDSDLMHFILGKAYVKLGRYQEALQEMQKARGINQNLEEAWEPIAIAALKLGYKDVALPAAERWVQFDPSMEAQRTYVQAGLLVKDFPACHKALDYMLKQKPGNAEALALSSKVYEEEGDKKKAEEFKQKALQADPNVFGKL